MVDLNSSNSREAGYPWCPCRTPFTERQLAQILFPSLGEIDRPIFATRSIALQTTGGREVHFSNYWDLLYEDVSRTLVALDVRPTISGSIIEEVIDRAIGLYEATELWGIKLNMMPAEQVDGIFICLREQSETEGQFEELQLLHVPDLRDAVLPLIQIEAKNISHRISQLGYVDSTRIDPERSGSNVQFIWGRACPDW